jgi:uncharacterized protein YjbJ (UPF0337 family)
LQRSAFAIRLRLACGRHRRPPWEPAVHGSSEVASATERDRNNPMGEIIDKVKGKLKRAVGILAGDKKLEREGRADEAKGKVEGAVEDVKHAFKDTLRK